MEKHVCIHVNYFEYNLCSVQRSPANSMEKNVKMMTFLLYRSNGEHSVIISVRDQRAKKLADWRNDYSYYEDYPCRLCMDVSKNRGIPKSSILIGCSLINHPFWGTTIFGNTRMTNPSGSVDQNL